MNFHVIQSKYFEHFIENLLFKTTNSIINNNTTKPQRANFDTYRVDDPTYIL